jgi:hypothetical protein
VINEAVLLGVFRLACEALGRTKETYAFTVFERVFKELAYPK